MSYRKDRSMPRAEDELSKRRIRNRLSQRHFRERKSNYIRELEERVHSASLNESERNSFLIEDIAELRNATLKLRLQLSKIATELESVSTEIGQILEVSDGTRKTKQCRDDEMDAHEQNKRQDRQPSPTVLENRRSNSTGVCIPPTQPVGESAQMTSDPIEQSQQDICFDEGEAVADQDIHANGIDGTSHSTGADLDGVMALDNAIPPYENMHATEIDAVTATSLWGDWPGDHESITPMALSLPSRNPSQTHVILPPGHFPPNGVLPDCTKFSKPSSFSQHIELLELQARCKVDGAPDKATRDMLDRCCSTMLSTFVGNAWPHTWSVWFKSQVPSIIVPILSWRIYPSIESFKGLLPDYKPTPTQLREPHSAVIDWVPYAPLRDRVILFYNGSAELDRLLCDMLNSYVIEVEDLSRVLPSAPPGKAYFGIWNLFSALDEVAPNIQMSGNYFDNILQFSDFRSDTYLTANALDPQAGNHSESDLEQALYNDMNLKGRPVRLADVLTSPLAVAAISRHVELHQARTWRLDRTFFEKWPELKFIGYEEIVAQGRSCRLPTEAPQGPIEITTDVMQAYQEALQSLA